MMPPGEGRRPRFSPLFTEVRGRGILRSSRGVLLRVGLVYRGRRIDSPIGCARPTTTREPLMGRNDEPTRLPLGYRLDLLGDPCVIVLRRTDGTLVARFTPFADPMEIRQAAEEDRQRAVVEPDG
jgi:hypothetical protein